MTLALRELRRRPGRFALATVILTLIALLLLFLGGLLDGLLAGSTGAYRAQRADLIVYSANASESLVRSRLTPEHRKQVEEVDGVESVGGLASVQLGARHEDEPDARDLISTVVFGYELAPRGLPDEPPARGEVIADSVLKADDVSEGDTILIGPQRTPLRVIGFVDDTRYAGQTSLWGSLETWQDVVAANRPDLMMGEGVVQAFVVRTSDGSADDVAREIDSATSDSTETLTISAATESLPGVSQQRSTFNQIIGVTVVIAMVVVALFFALITLERTSLYGVLKALGASNGYLLAGVVGQALTVTLIASAIGIAAALALDAVIPAGSIPFEVTTSRLITSVLLLVGAAIAGSAFSLRRVLRIEPASAIGAAS